MRMLGLGTMVLGLLLACGGGPVVVQAEASWPCGACELYDVDVDGRLAYVSDSVGGVTVLDLSDPEKPVVTGTLAGEKTIAAGVAGNRLVLADWKKGLVVADRSDPEAPVEKTTTKASGRYFVESDGTNVFIPGAVYDVSGAEPENVGKLPGRGGNGAQLVGSRLYVAASTSGFRIVDVANPAAPVLLGEAEADYAKDVAVKGDHAFVPAQNAKAVLVFDVSDPKAPKEVARIDGLKKPTGAAIEGDRLFVADGRAGIRRYDIQDPTAPKALAVAHADSGAVYKVTATPFGVFGAADGELLIAPL